MALTVRSLFSGLFAGHSWPEVSGIAFDLCPEAHGVKWSQGLKICQVLCLWQMRSQTHMVPHTVYLPTLILHPSKFWTVNHLTRRTSVVVLLILQFVLWPKLQLLTLIPSSLLLQSLNTFLWQLSVVVIPIRGWQKRTNKQTNKHSKQLKTDCLTHLVSDEWSTWRTENGRWNEQDRSAVTTGDNHLQLNMSWKQTTTKSNFTFRMVFWGRTFGGGGCNTTLIT